MEAFWQLWGAAARQQMAGQGELDLAWNPPSKPRTAGLRRSSSRELAGHGQVGILAQIWSAKPQASP